MTKGEWGKDSHSEVNPYTHGQGSETPVFDGKIVSWVSQGPSSFDFHRG